jgi:glycerol dehydrogenase
MITTTIFPGRYIQGYEAIKELTRLIPKYGTKGFLILSPSSYEKILPEIRESLEEAVPITAEKFGRECSDEEITRLSEMATAEGCDVIIGIGGGKTLDTAKAVAHGMKAPVFIVPTIASTDAPCSALSVIYRPNGQIKRFLVYPRNPDVVLVDTKIIVEGPVRLLISGMGDALATWFEAESCMIKHAKNMTRNYGSMTAYALAQLCYETLLEHGMAAKLACEAGVVIPALEHVVEANTLLSGIGFESGGVAAAHAIHDGLNGLEATHAYYHGEKVAFGTLASLFLTDKPSDIIDEVYSFIESVGLPTTLSELGLGDASEEELMKVAKIACSERESIHNEPMPVTETAVFAAIIAADGEGKRRKLLIDF